MNAALDQFYAAHPQVAMQLGMLLLIAAGYGLLVHATAGEKQGERAMLTALTLGGLLLAVRWIIG